MNDNVKNQLSKLDKKPETPPQEEEFQQYHSAKPSVRLITDNGFRITFTKFQYITQNQDAIDYLDAQIKLGIPGIIKGEIVTTTDLDPMAKLRKEIEEEVRAKLIKEAKDEALGIEKDMGETESKAGMKVASSKTVAK